MKSKYREFSIGAFLFVAYATAGSETVDESRLETFFKWGRYDSLIRVLEPALKSETPSSPIEKADSLRIAKGNLYLGVAYFARRNPVESDQALRRAFAYDPEIRLDRFYVSKEIAARFDAIALSVSAASSRTSVPDSPAPDRAQVRSAHGKGDWIWWSVGTLATLAVSGSAWFFLVQPAETIRVETTINTRSKP